MQANLQHVGPVARGDEDANFSGADDVIANAITARSAREFLDPARLAATLQGFRDGNYSGLHGMRRCMRWRIAALANGTRMVQNLRDAVDALRALGQAQRQVMLMAAHQPLAKPAAPAQQGSADHQRMTDVIARQKA